MVLTERQKKWARYGGYVAVGLVTFVFAAHYAFPYERLEQPLVAGLSEYFEVSDMEIGPGFWPGHAVIEDVTLKTRPKNEDDKPVEIVLDRVDLDLGLWAGLSKTVDLGIEGEIGDGVVEGHVRSNKEETRVEFSTRSLPLATIPGAEVITGGALLDGGLTAHVKLELPKNKWAQADGLIELECEDCVLPKGAKFRPMAARQRDAFTNNGFTLPAALRLGQFSGRVEIEEGHGEFVDFQSKSPDGELILEGNIEFHDPVGTSLVTAYMRLKLTDELKRREPKMVDVENLSLAPARRDDGYFGVRLTGPLSGMSFRGARVSPLAVSAPHPRGPVRRPVPPRPSFTPPPGASVNPGMPAPAPSPVPSDVPIEPPAATPFGTNVGGSAAIKLSNEARDQAERLKDEEATRVGGAAVPPPDPPPSDIPSPDEPVTDDNAAGEGEHAPPHEIEHGGEEDDRFVE